MNKPEDPIRINDQEFKFDELPLKAQNCVTAVTGIDKSLNQLASQMDLLQMARKGYIDNLNDALKPEDPDAA